MSMRAMTLSRRDTVPALLPVAAGLLLLLARVEIVSMGSATVALLVLVYCALGVVSLAPRPASITSLLSPGVVALVGIGAVAAVSAAPWRIDVPSIGSVGAVALGVLAAVAEEAFFRRLLYASLLPAGVAAAVIGSAVLFALVHVPLYGTSVVWLDLGAGLLLSWQRWASGSWVAPATTHAFANVLAVLR
jgi:membrane protease YdiL (CAAX protease family)